MKTKIKRMFIATVTIIVLSFIVWAGFPIFTQDTCVFTVTDKDRIVEGTGDYTSSKYLVYTDKETFENTDCGIWFKFSSSDLQGKLQKGSMYKAKVYGWRLPFFSSYRNIVKAELIE